VRSKDLLQWLIVIIWGAQWRIQRRGRWVAALLASAIFSISRLFPHKTLYSSLCAFAINDDTDVFQRRMQEFTEGVLYRRDATGAHQGICVRGRPPLSLRSHSLPLLSPSPLSSSLSLFPLTFFYLLSPLKYICPLKPAIGGVGTLYVPPSPAGSGAEPWSKTNLVHSKAVTRPLIGDNYFQYFEVGVLQNYTSVEG